MLIDTNAIHETIQRTVYLSVIITFAALGSAPVLAQQSPVITLRTLAEIQQWQDEMNLRERLDQLQQRNGGQRGGSTPVRMSTSLSTQASASDPPKAERISHRPPAPAARRRPTLKLLSVYGPTHRLNAEALDRHGDVRALEQNDRIGDWVVANIRQEGLLLHRDRVGASADRGVFVAVGESMDDGARP